MQMTGKLLLQMTVCMVAYFGIGILFYTQVEKMSVVDALYFQMVCASTVGYGDISPTGAEGSDTVSPGMATLSRIFTLVWILIGSMWPATRTHVPQSTQKTL